MPKVNVYFYVFYGLNIGEKLHLIRQNSEEIELNRQMMIPLGNGYKYAMVNTNPVTFYYPGAHYYKFEIKRYNEIVREEDSFRFINIPGGNDNEISISVYNNWNDHCYPFYPIPTQIPSSDSIFANVQNNVLRVCIDIIDREPPKHCNLKLEQKLRNGDTTVCPTFSNGEITFQFEISKPIFDDNSLLHNNSQKYSVNGKEDTLYHFFTNQTDYIYCNYFLSQASFRFSSIYVPLISFRSENKCDVGTFTTIKHLVDFCEKCGIYQLFLHIEHINDSLTIDPAHIDIPFDPNNLESFDINSIRNEKLKELKKLFEEKKTQPVTKEKYNHLFFDGSSDFKSFLQFMCYYQLEDAYVYACSKKINLMISLIPDENIETMYQNIYTASVYSNSIYINNSFDGKFNLQELIRILKLYPSTSIVNPIISQQITKEELVISNRILLTGEYQNYQKSQPYILEPKHISPSTLSAYPIDETREDICNDIFRRIKSDADVCIVYLFDLLYLTLPEASRNPPQPIQLNDGDMRYLFNVPVTQISESAIKRIKDIMRIGNR